MWLYVHKSQKAVWCIRFASLSFLLFVGTVLWHRFLSATPYALPTPIAFKLIGIATFGAALSLIIGALAVYSIWVDGYRGAGRASFGIFLSFLVLFIPLTSVRALWRLPQITDITTDTEAPPAFDHLARIRSAQAQANPIRYDASFAPLQKQSYPDITAVLVKRPVADVYNIARDTMVALKWKIIDEQTPDNGKAGRMEATDQTLIFGLVDDVVVRVAFNGKQTKVDIRSSSRYGSHDLGRNARRIRLFLSELKTRLDRQDQLDAFNNSSLMTGRLVHNTKSTKTTTASNQSDDIDTQRFNVSTATINPSGTANTSTSPTQTGDATNAANQQEQEKPKKRRGRSDGFHEVTRFFEGIF